MLRLTIALAFLVLPGCASRHDNAILCDTTPNQDPRCEPAYSPTSAPEPERSDEPKPPPGHAQQQLAPH